VQTLHLSAGEEMSMDMFIYVTSENLYGFKMMRKQYEDENLDDMTDGEFISKFGYTEHPRVEEEEEEEKA